MSDGKGGDFGIVTECGSVRFERVLEAPPAKVWDYLTDGEKLGRWFAGGEIEPRLGGEASLTFHHDRLSDTPEPIPERYKGAQGYSFTGEITAWEPPRRLAWTWPDDKHPSTVTFELFPHGKGHTRLVLTHSRLPDRKAWIDVMGGWHSHLGILEDLAAGRPRRPFWGSHAGLEQRYAERVAPEGALYVSRRLAAPVERVFAAWTDPAEVRAWGQVTLASDRRQGGRYHSETAPGSADNCVVEGVYRVFEPNRRIVQTWFYKGPGAPEPVESLVALDFVPDGADATLVTVTETGAEAQDPRTRTASAEAWRSVFGALARHLETARAPSART